MPLNTSVIPGASPSHGGRALCIHVGSMPATTARTVHRTPDGMGNRPLPPPSNAGSDAIQQFILANGLELGAEAGRAALRAWGVGQGCSVKVEVHIRNQREAAGFDAGLYVAPPSKGMSKPLPPPVVAVRMADRTASPMAEGDLQMHGAKSVGAPAEDHQSLTSHTGRIIECVNKLKPQDSFHLLCHKHGLDRSDACVREALYNQVERIAPERVDDLARFFAWGALPDVFQHEAETACAAGIDRAPGFIGFCRLISALEQHGGDRLAAWRRLFECSPNLSFAEVFATTGWDPAAEGTYDRLVCWLCRNKRLPELDYYARMHELHVYYLDRNISMPEKIWAISNWPVGQLDEMCTKLSLDLCREDVQERLWVRASNRGDGLDVQRLLRDRGVHVHDPYMALDTLYPAQAPDGTLSEKVAWFAETLRLPQGEKARKACSEWIALHEAGL